MAGSRREALIVSGLCLAWYSISSASNVVGKVVLTEFSYPMTVTMVQLVSIVFYSAATFSCCGVRREVQVPSPYYWRAIVPLAFAKFLTTICSQVSIWKVPISYAHTVKATTPLWTAGLAWILFGERQSRGIQLSLVVIALGVAVASATELHFDSIGLSAALAAAALLSLQHIFSKRVMRETGMHHLRLLQLLGRVALVMFAPVWMWCDGLALWEGAEPRDGWLRGGSLLAADGALAWLQAVVAFSVLSRVTPLTYAVASAAKRAVVVAASLVLFRNPAPPLNLTGMALALFGVLVYNRAKVQARQDPPRRPLLPV